MNAMEEKKELIKILNIIADLMEFRGENQFKIKAFKNGASALRSYDGKLEDLIRKENPVKIKGIGKGILSVISDFLYNDKITELERVAENVPAGISSLFEIKGLGIKKIKFLYENFGIQNIADLERVISNGKLNDVKGFGAKTLEKISDEIQKLKVRRKFMLLNEAEYLATEVIQKIKAKSDAVKKAEISGELRRVREVIKKVEIVLLLKNSKEVFEAELANIFEYNKLSTDTYTSVYKLTNYGEKEILLYAVSEKSEFVKLHFQLTGNENFIKTFSLPDAPKNEREIFDINNLPYIIPEMREHDPNEIKSPNSDLCFAEMNAMLHFHTIASDGHNSLEEMIHAGLKRGFNYFAVCDHSKSAYYANGLDEKRLQIQNEEIKALSEKLNVPIMHGSEVDILPDGSLDFEDEILAKLDFVVASVHSSFRLEEDKMTARIIKAVENPYVVALGHPTGRLLLRRDAYKVNIRKVIDACAANSVAIEINANPWRLDLDWRLLEYAKEKGAIFTINADAHSTSDIDYTKYGVKIARKGGLLQDEIINYWSYEKLIDFIAKKRN